jgi:hypothetical protein
MRTRSKLLAGIGAALLLALAVASASAARLSVSETGFSIRWSAMTFGYGIEDVTCPVTLHGTFHSRTMRKVSGALVGSVNQATVANASCTGGRLTFLQATLPWHIRYHSFTGVLPIITGIKLSIIGVAIRLEVVEEFCLFVTTAAEPFSLIMNVGRSGEVTSTRMDEASVIDLNAGGFLCDFGGDMTISGAGTVDGDSSTLIFYRLI